MIQVPLGRYANVSAPVRAPNQLTSTGLGIIGCRKCEAEFLHVWMRESGSPVSKGGSERTMPLCSPGVVIR